MPPIDPHDEGRDDRVRQQDPGHAPTGDPRRGHADPHRGHPLHRQVVHRHAAPRLPGRHSGQDSAVHGAEQHAVPGVDHRHRGDEHPRPRVHAEGHEHRARADHGDAQPNGRAPADAVHHRRGSHRRGQGDQVGGHQHQGDAGGVHAVVVLADPGRDGGDRESQGVGQQDQADRAQPPRVGEERPGDEGLARPADVRPEDRDEGGQHHQERPRPVRRRDGQRQGAAAEHREPEDVDAARARPGRDAPAHDRDARQADQGDEQEEDPVHPGQPPADDQPDGGGPLEGRGHEAHVEGSAARIRDGRRQDHVHRGGRLAPQDLQGARHDHPPQRRRGHQAQQRPRCDEDRPGVDDAPERDEVAQGAVEEAGDPQDDAGDSGDQGHRVARADGFADLQVHQVEALERDRARDVDAQQRQQDAGGAGGVNAVIGSGIAHQQ